MNFFALSPWAAYALLAGVALLLSRQSIPTLDRDEVAPAELLARGGYVLWDSASGETPPVVQGRSADQREGADVAALDAADVESEEAAVQRESELYRGPVLSPSPGSWQWLASSFCSWARPIPGCIAAPLRT